PRGSAARRAPPSRRVPAGSSGARIRDSPSQNPRMRGAGAMPQRPPRTRRLRRDRGFHGRTAKPRCRSFPYPLAVAHRGGITQIANPIISLSDHDVLLLLLVGLAIDALFGDLPAVFAHVPHPVVLAGHAIAFFDRKLNRASRSDRIRRERGIVTVVVLVGIAAAIGSGIEWLCRGSVLGALVEAFVIGVLLAQRRSEERRVGYGSMVRM